MAGVMQKRCTACGKHHPLSAMRCSCGARLIDAPVVTVEMAEPTVVPPPSKEEPAGTWKCESCQFEQNSEADSHCRLCELVRPSIAGAPSTGDAPTATYVLRFPFGEVKITAKLAIGRDSEFCSFSEQLQTFEKVSRKHALMEFEAGAELYLVDMGSTNGTYLNGIRLDRNARAAVKIGDEVSFSKGLTAQICRGT